MPHLDREVVLKLLDAEFGITAARRRGEKPPNAVKLLAERTGLPRRTLSGAVHGRDQIADYRIVRIADALGVNPRALVRMSDPTPEEQPQPKPEEPKPKIERTAPAKRRNGGSGTRPPRVSAA